MTTKYRPSLILGSAMWGWTVPASECFKLLDYFYAQGFREVDGATNYPINKNPEDFRRAESILMEWIKVNGVGDLKVMMKVGSINNLRTPEHNLKKSFMLINLDDYTHRLGSNFDTLMIHWDNRDDPEEIQQTLEGLAVARQQGLRIGLSGIKFPKIYADLNRSFDFDFRIQMKHNLLKSDYPRYQVFHGKPRFITYGINAGGIKFSTAQYEAASSLRARGGDTSQLHPIVADLKAKIAELKMTDTIVNFNQCGMLYAYYSPDIQAILIGPSRLSQLQKTIDFYQALSVADYYQLYEPLTQIAEEYHEKI